MGKVSRVKAGTKALFGRNQDGASKALTQKAVIPAPNGRVPCQEHDHLDDEEISPHNFPWAEIFPAFVGWKFDPNVMNIFLGRLFSKNHHMKGEGAKTKSDFKSFKACFCLEWILVLINGQWYWVRCGHMFNLFSSGCIDHPRASYKDGPNSIYPLLHDSKSGSWRMIKNLNIEQGELTDDEICAKAQEDVDALGEQMAVAAREGECTEQLEEAHKEKMQLITHSRTREEIQRQADAAVPQSGKSKAIAVAAPVTAMDGLRSAGNAPPIYGARRRAGNSTPGDPVLDQKQADLRRGKNKYRTNAQWQTLAAVPEEERPTERKKPKKKNHVADNPEDGLREL